MLWLGMEVVRLTYLGKADYMEVMRAVEDLLDQSHAVGGREERRPWC